MASEGLAVQVAVDTRLIVENPTQVITVGAAQNLPRFIPATSVSGSQLQWNNVLSIGNNVLIDPNWVIEYDVAITFDAATANMAGVNLPGIYNAGGEAPPVPVKQPYGVQANAQIPNVGFSQFPLTRNTNSIALQFNNVETTVNASQLLNNCREWILNAERKREMASSCPTFNYVSPNTVASSGANGIVPNQPLTPYSHSAGYSRVSYFPKSLSQVGETTRWTAIYTLREPVFIGVLTQSISAGLANVQSINLRYNLDNSNGLLGMLQSPVALTATEITSITIVSANLYLDYLTVDTSKTGPLPAIAYYNYEFPEFQQTLLSGLTDEPVGPGSYQQTTQSYKLSTMPKWYYVKLSPNIQGLKPQNNMCGFAITQMQIQFGSLGIFNFNREQLWIAFKRNTDNLDITYPQWVALGTPVILEPAIDIGAGAGDLFQGKTNDSGIMFQNTITYSLENYYNALPDGGSISADLGVDVANCYAYEVFVASGSCAIGMGTCVFKTTTCSEAEFLAALDSKDMVSQTALEAAAGAHGGSFMNKLKSVIHGAKKVAGVAAKALQHPLVQKGLEHLAGSGMSAGALSHSLRRRK